MNREALRNSLVWLVLGDVSVSGTIFTALNVAHSGLPLPLPNLILLLATGAVGPAFIAIGVRKYVRASRAEIRRLRHG